MFRRKPLFYAKVLAYAMGTAFAWMHMAVPMILAVGFATWAAFKD